MASCSRNHLKRQLVRSWISLLLLYLTINSRLIGVLAEIEPPSPSIDDLELQNGQIKEHVKNNATDKQVKIPTPDSHLTTNSGNLDSTTDNEEESSALGDLDQWTRPPATLVPFLPTEETSLVKNASRKINLVAPPRMDEGTTSLALCGSQSCAKNEKCYGPDDNISLQQDAFFHATSCHCHLGFVRSRESSQLANCICPPSKFLTEENKCQEANRVYHSLIYLLISKSSSLSKLINSNDSSSLQSIEDYRNLTQPVEEALNSHLQGKKVLSQLSCQQVGSISKRSNGSEDEALMTKTVPINCFFKFKTDPDFILNIPTDAEVASLFRTSAASVISTDRVNLSEYDYCRQNEHNCDLQTTTCSFQPSDRHISCPCLALHSRMNQLKCLYDQTAGLNLFNHLDIIDGRHSDIALNGISLIKLICGVIDADLWIALYVFIGLFTLAFIALIAALLLLKARPAKATRRQENERIPRFSVSRYENKLPRPTLTITNLDHTTREQQNRPNSTINTLAGPPITPTSGPLDQSFAQGPRISQQLPISPSHFDRYTQPASRTSSADIKTNDNKQTLQEMATFKRLPSQSGQLGLSNANKRHSPAPLASSESSMELPACSGKSVGDRSRAASGVISSPRLMKGLDGVSPHYRADGEGVFFSINDSAAVYQAIQQHRHSAILNLMQSHKDSTAQTNV